MNIQTRCELMNRSADDMKPVSAASVDLIVTSPPYPMISMWDETFSRQDAKIEELLGENKGAEAFERMHALLDAVWGECDRVLKDGGIACINIGDATRTLDHDFQLYSNHSRILSAFLKRGYAALPDILWRKQTNAPNKFMGSGMLPVGAYVTYEHEYVLILRKGLRRKFVSADEKALRRSSAFFWEERNLWFSDVWEDLKGTRQTLVDAAARERSAAFPFELAYRLIQMYSIKGDCVLDPFAGTGTTLAAAMASGRNAVGVEIDGSLEGSAMDSLSSIVPFANAYTRERLSRHVDFVKERVERSGSMKHKNTPYGFPVMTLQEKDLLIHDLLHVESDGEHRFVVTCDDRPQTDVIANWKKCLNVGEDESELA